MQGKRKEHRPLTNFLTRIVRSNIQRHLRRHNPAEFIVVFMVLGIFSAGLGEHRVLSTRTSMFPMRLIVTGAAHWLASSGLWVSSE
jgi:hypothetical protein